MLLAERAGNWPHGNSKTPGKRIINIVRKRNSGQRLFASSKVGVSEPSDPSFEKTPNAGLSTQSLDRENCATSHLNANSSRTLSRSQEAGRKRLKCQECRSTSKKKLERVVCLECFEDLRARLGKEFLRLQMEAMNRTTERNFLAAALDSINRKTNAAAVDPKMMN